MVCTAAYFRFDGCEMGDNLPVLELTELNAADIHATVKWALHDQDAQRATSELATEITATLLAIVVVDHALALVDLA